MNWFERLQSSDVRKAVQENIYDVVTRSSCCGQTHNISSCRNGLACVPVHDSHPGKSIRPSPAPHQHGLMKLSSGMGTGLCLLLALHLAVAQRDSRRVGARNLKSVIKAKNCLWHCDLASKQCRPCLAPKPRRSWAAESSSSPGKRAVVL